MDARQPAADLGAGGRSGKGGGMDGTQGQQNDSRFEGPLDQTDKRLSIFLDDDANALCDERTATRRSVG